MNDQVLIVDDEPQIRRFCMRALEQEGYRVDTSATAAKALDLLASKRFDLLVADIKMPGMDGLELMRRARLLYPNLTIVVITGHVTFENAAEALDAGACKFLLKPFIVDELVDAIEQALALKERASEQVRLAALLPALKIGETAAAEAQGAALPHRLLTIVAEEMSADAAALFRIEAGDSWSITAHWTRSGATMGTGGIEELQHIFEHYAPGVGTEQMVIDGPRDEWEGQLWLALGFDPRGIALYAPLDSGEQVLVIHRCRRNPFLDSEQKLLATMSRFVGIALDNARLNRRVAQSRQLWEATFDAIADGIFVLDGDFTILEANRSLAKMLDTIPHALVGQKCYQAIDAEVCTPVDCPRRARLDDDKPSSVERHVPSLGGYFLCSTYPVRDGYNGTSAWVQVIKDITDRKRAKLELQKSEERFRSLVESINEIVFTLDRDGRCTSVHGRHLAKFGIDAEALLGKSLLGMLRAFGIKAPNTHTWAVERAMSGDSIVYEWSSQDEVVHHFQMSLSPLYDSSAKIAGVVGLSRDISERKKTEAALRVAQERLEHLVGTSPAIIYSRNLGQGYDTTYVSDNVRQVLGYEPSAFLNDPAFWLSRIHQDDLPSLIEGLRTLAERGRHSWEYRFLHGDGEYRWTHDSARVVFDATGEAAEVVGSWIDITERKEAEAEIRRSHEQLHALAAHLQTAREEERAIIAREIHDEFGQMLTALLMDLHWLMKRVQPGEVQVEPKLESMVEAVHKMIDMVRRIATRLRPGVLDDLGLASAIEWLADDFQTRTGIECELSLPGEEPAPNRELDITLFRICQEALTNVARHAGATRVRVHLEARDGERRLTVADNGRGITPQEIARPASLGLTGMRERVRPWGGAISLQGTPGEGTTVEAHIPSTRAKEQRDG